jgi:putative spermidine/putrescine transport system substrate-binding protein
MDRRSFLRMGVLGLASWGLTGCEPITAETLTILGLKNAIPAPLLKGFRQQLKANGGGQNLAYSQRQELKAIFQQLQDWQRLARAEAQNQPIPSKFALPNPFVAPNAAAIDPIPDLVSLGDYWLEVAIRQGLVQPLEPQQWPTWRTVDPIWQRWTTRNDQGQLAADGKVWAAPYRWGATVIVYRRDIFADRQLAPPRDWSDLLRPELKGRISLPDSAREVIGLALKSLGRNYTNDNNPIDLATVPDLEARLRSLHQQAKFYSSDAYLQPLLLDHTWLAVGWSSDILPQFRNRPELAAIVPQSGTSLWADLWVRPKRTKVNSNRNFNPWINFFWNPENAAKLAQLGRSGSPLAQRTISLTAAQQTENPLLNLPDAVWQKCEPLPPLDQARAQQYYSLWATVRQ